MHKRRITVLFGCVVAAFALVEVRLFYLQGVRGEHYAEYADRQRIGLLPVDVARARILTSDGAVLAEDRLACDIAVVIGKLDPSGERRIRGPLRRLFYVPRREQLRRIADAGFEIRPPAGDGAPPTVRAWSKLHVEFRDGDGGPLVDIVDREVEFPVPERVVTSADELARLTGEPADEILLRVLETAVDVARLRTPVFSPVAVLEGVAYETVAAVETRPAAFRGFVVRTRFERVTPSGPLAPHLVGYLAKFNRRDVETAVERYRA